MSKLSYFVTVRSPFSYLSAQRVAQLAGTPGVSLDFCPVYPLAQRAPTFFEAGHPALLGYLRRDAERVAEMRAIPFAWPDPDPVLQDLATAKIAKDQPHIFFLTRLLAAAAELGQGFAFYQQISALIFDGTRSWIAAGELAEAAQRAKLDFEHVAQHVATNEKGLDAKLAANAEKLDAAGHWGTPSLVFGEEVFFGQDRIEMCAWHMRKLGYPVPSDAR